MWPSSSSLLEDDPPHRVIDTSSLDRSVWDDQGLFFSLGISVLVTTLVIIALTIVKIIIVGKTTARGADKDVALARLFRPKHLTSAYSRAPVSLREETKSSMFGAFPTSLFRNWLSIDNVDEVPENQEEFFLHDLIVNACGGVGGDDMDAVGGKGEGKQVSTLSAGRASRGGRSDGSPLLGEAYYVRVTTTAADASTRSRQSETTAAPSSSSSPRNRRPAWARFGPRSLLPFNSNPLTGLLTLDPNVEVFLFYCRMCVALFFVASIVSVMWVTVVAGVDRYYSNYNVRTDSYRCKDQSSTSDCELSMHCRWGIVGSYNCTDFVANNTTININTTSMSPCFNTTDAYPSAYGCYPIAVDGLYDLSVQNLYPILESGDSMYDPHVPYKSPGGKDSAEVNTNNTSVASALASSAWSLLVSTRDSVFGGYVSAYEAATTSLLGNTNSSEFIPGLMTLPSSAPTSGESRGRLLAVAILALVYGILFAWIVVVSLRGVNGYVMKVMRIQSRNSLGYRTVLIRGVPERLLPGTAQLQLRLLESDSSSDSDNEANGGGDEEESDEDGDGGGASSVGFASFDPILGATADKTVNGPHLAKGGTKRFWRRYLSVGGLCVGGGRAARDCPIVDSNAPLTASIDHDHFGSWLSHQEVQTSSLSLFDGTPTTLKTWNEASRPRGSSSPSSSSRPNNQSSSPSPSPRIASTFARLKNAFLAKSVCAVIPCTVVSLGLKRDYMKYLNAKQNLEDAIGAERAYHRELEAKSSATSQGNVVDQNGAIKKSTASGGERGGGVHDGGEEPLLSKPVLLGRILPAVWKKVPLVETRKELLRAAAEELNKKIERAKADCLETEKKEILKKKASIAKVVVVSDNSLSSSSGSPTTTTGAVQGEEGGGGFSSPSSPVDNNDNTSSSATEKKIRKREDILVAKAKLTGALLDSMVPTEDDDRHYRRHIQHSGGVFVVFKDAQCAFEYIQVFNHQYGGLLRNQRATIAGPPSEIMETVLGNNKFVSTILCSALVTGFVWLIFFWAIPVAFFGSLSQLSTLPGIGQPIGEIINSIPLGLRNILQAYLPILVIALFNIFLPDIARKIVSVGGTPTKAATDYWQAVLMFSFSFINGVVLQAALQGGLTQLAALIKSPSEESVGAFIVAIISPQGGYWYASVVSGYIGQWIAVALLAPLLLMKVFVSRVGTQRAYDALFKTWDASFHMMFTSLMISMGMGVLFHFSVPLLGIFVGVFFICAYFAHRGILLDNYVPKLNPTTQMVSSFRLLVTALRMLCVLYFVASIGTVIVCSLKNSPGASSVASLSVIIGAGVAVYCFYITRRWTPTLLKMKEWASIDFDNLEDVARVDGCLVHAITKSPSSSVLPAAVVVEGAAVGAGGGSSSGDRSMPSVHDTTSPPPTLPLQQQNANNNDATTSNHQKVSSAGTTPSSPSASPMRTITSSTSSSHLLPYSSPHVAHPPLYTPEEAAKRLQAAFPLNFPSDYFSEAENIFPVTDVELVIMEAEGKNYSIVRHWHGDIAMDDVVSLENNTNTNNINTAVPLAGGGVSVLEESTCPRMAILNTQTRERQDAGQRDFGGDGARPIVHYELRRDVIDEAWTVDGDAENDDDDEEDTESNMPMSIHYGARGGSESFLVSSRRNNNRASNPNYNGRESQVSGGVGGESTMMMAESLYAESFHPANSRLSR